MPSYYAPEKCRDCGANMTGFASSDGGSYSACEETYGSGSHEFLIKDLRERYDVLVQLAREAAAVLNDFPPEPRYWQRIQATNIASAIEKELDRTN